MKTDKNCPMDPIEIAGVERERILDVLANMTRTNSRYGTAYYVTPYPTGSIRRYTA